MERGGCGASMGPRLGGAGHSHGDDFRRISPISGIRGLEVVPIGLGIRTDNRVGVDIPVFGVVVEMESSSLDRNAG